MRSSGGVNTPPAAPSVYQILRRAPGGYLPRMLLGKGVASRVDGRGSPGPEGAGKPNVPPALV